MSTQTVIAGAFVTGVVMTIVGGINRPAAATPPFKPRTLISKPFPAIKDAEFEAAAESDVRDSELVLGVVVDGKSRAYPINMLTGPRREIINDTLGKRPIAATW